MNRFFLTQAISFLFVFLFMYAAVSKLIDYDRFKIQLGQSPLLNPFANGLAWAVPALEMLIAGLLLFSRSRLQGLYASFGLMTLFTLYIFFITRFSDYVPCSCGGILQNMNWNQHLVFNILFVVLGVLGVFGYRSAAPAK